VQALIALEKSSLSYTMSNGDTFYIKFIVLINCYAHGHALVNCYALGLTG
jgi:hypothetical protein